MTEQNTKLTIDGLYALADQFYTIPINDKRHVRAQWAGEKRAPRKGEWYLSGAIIEAYEAPNDLTTDYRIARLVQVKVRTVVDVIGPYAPPSRK